MYLITGASGNTGKRIAQTLLKEGKSVKVISRNAENIQNLIEQGAIAAIGDLSDAKFLSEAFKGVKAVYAMIPPNFATNDFRAYQNEVGNALAHAIENSEVKHVVTLSSIGAHLSKNSGVILGLHDFEQRLSKIEGLAVRNLRAGFFMENFLGMINTVAQAGVLGGFPISGDIAMPIVHTADIASRAAQLLSSLDFSGQDHEYVAGTSDLTLQEAATILGTAIGKPDLVWVQFPYEDAAAAMLQMGLTQSLVDAYIDFCKSANDLSLTGDYRRTPNNTTHTSLEHFAQNEFAPVWDAQQQSV